MSVMVLLIWQTVTILGVRPRAFTNAHYLLCEAGYRMNAACKLRVYGFTGHLLSKYLND